LELIDPSVNLKRNIGFNSDESTNFYNKQISPSNRSKFQQMFPQIVPKASIELTNSI